MSSIFVKQNKNVVDSIKEALSVLNENIAW